ncbi:hypothetical protein BKA67DRAFT_532709 [Truncatella angustata]|uniref:Uncharacterized protein n=1 Tax=Truncatella angustata TaxID=152316 RepID=A0A9P8USW7_9PEZI|nr:uncharacterized protein BKA67DRAFT_532709 [Truncatella angustata]KAH6657502.1 hypothetical protein BKA67DRAFT_532709 [Truncatella angustata]
MDPRDRIYGILNILDDRLALRTVPDYTQTPTQVFEDVATRFIQSFKNLDILVACEFALNHAGPSWMPDWSKPTAVGCPESAFFGSLPVQMYTEITDKALRAVGRIASLVEDTVEDIFGSCRSYTDWLQAISSVIQMAFEKPHPDTDILLESCTRALGSL